MSSHGSASAVWLSVVVGAWSALLGLPVAVGLGWVLARKRFPLRPVVSALVLAPLVLPPVVTGLVLLRVFGRAAPLGAWLAARGMPVAFSRAGAVLAAFVVGVPLYVASARAAFEAADPRYEEVSLALGVPPARTFARVTLPLAAPGIVAGAVLAFARALGEFGATIVLAGDAEGETRTIALAVYALLDAPGGDGAAWRLVAASVALAAAALAGYEALVRWQRRRLAS